MRDRLEALAVGDNLAANALDPAKRRHRARGLGHKLIKRIPFLGAA
jgi:hypothetical protein